MGNLKDPRTTYGEELLSERLEMVLNEREKVLRCQKCYLYIKKLKHFISIWNNQYSSYYALSL